MPYRRPYPASWSIFQVTTCIVVTGRTGDEAVGLPCSCAMPYHAPDWLRCRLRMSRRTGCSTNLKCLAPYHMLSLVLFTTLQQPMRVWPENIYWTVLILSRATTPMLASSWSVTSIKGATPRSRHIHWNRSWDHLLVVQPYWTKSTPISRIGTNDHSSYKTSVSQITMLSSWCRRTE